MEYHPALRLRFLPLLGSVAAIQQGFLRGSNPVSPLLQEAPQQPQEVAPPSSYIAECSECLRTEVILFPLGTPAWFKRVCKNPQCSRNGENMVLREPDFPNRYPYLICSSPYPPRQRLISQGNPPGEMKTHRKGDSSLPITQILLWKQNRQDSRQENRSPLHTSVWGRQETYLRQPHCGIVQLQYTPQHEFIHPMPTHTGRCLCCKRKIWLTDPENRITRDNLGRPCENSACPFFNVKNAPLLAITPVPKEERPVVFSRKKTHIILYEPWTYAPWRGQREEEDEEYTIHEELVYLGDDDFTPLVQCCPRCNRKVRSIVPSSWVKPLTTTDTLFSVECESKFCKFKGTIVQYRRENAQEKNLAPLPRDAHSPEQYRYFGKEEEERYAVPEYLLQEGDQFPLRRPPYSCSIPLFHPSHPTAPPPEPTLQVMLLLACMVGVATAGIKTLLRSARLLFYPSSPIGKTENPEKEAREKEEESTAGSEAEEATATWEAWDTP